ncbi:hypothetical protein ACVRXQ_07105 [Streptococcus panodentis]|uniref:ABC transporter permease n=1 Tax=Streptococcus panodentis TaxID=1581472 RepID=A0ABS5AUA6_9STRE|nr:hypothetical protein [Streptococcus panodentis]MBP2620150.1 hypothetical protein [Streptococcus panodentis]
MLQTFRADFFRLFRSKGFWGTELFFLLISAIIAVLAVTTAQPGDFSTALPAFEAISKDMPMMFIFMVIIISLLLGVELNNKLYHNTLTSGTSLNKYYLAKFMTFALIALLHFFLAYSTAFMASAFSTGFSSLPAAYWGQLGLSILVQYVCALAWIGIITFVLYRTKSIAVLMITFLLGDSILALPDILFPKVGWLQYLPLRFNITMVTEQGAASLPLLSALIAAAAFTAAGIYTLQTRDL